MLTDRPDDEVEYLLKYKLIQGGGFWNDFVSSCRNLGVEAATGCLTRHRLQLFFVANNHPLLSICYAAPNHPYDRQERLIVGGLLVGFAAGSSGFITAVHAQQCACPGSPEFDTPANLACVDDLSTTTTVLSVYNSIAMLIAGVLLKLFATCSCFQKRDSILARAKDTAEGIGRCFISTIGCMMVAWMIAGLVVVASQCPNRDTAVIYVQTFVQGKVLSWLMWFATSGGIFSLKYYCAKDKPENVELMRLVAAGRGREFGAPPKETTNPTQRAAAEASAASAVVPVAGSAAGQAPPAALEVHPAAQPAEAGPAPEAKEATATEKAQRAATDAAGAAASAAADAANKAKGAATKMFSRFGRK